MKRSFAHACACAAFALAGCSGGGGTTSSVAPTAPASAVPTPTSTLAPGSTTRYRMVIGEILARSIAADPIAGPLLDGSQPIVVLTGDNPPYGVSQPFAPAAWDASYMARFSSEAELAAAVQTGGVPAFVAWIMYDNEPDSQPPSPANELPPNDPAPYFAAAAALAHQAGKHFFATAGLSGTPQQQQDVFATATAWDLYGVQTQTGELNLTQFGRNIASTMASVWAVNAAVPFCAGVGDNAGGGLAVASQIVPAMESIPANGLVWMNFGPHTDGIPEHDDIAIQVIEDTILAPRASPLPTP